MDWLRCGHVEFTARDRLLVLPLAFYSPFSAVSSSAAIAGWPLWSAQPAGVERTFLSLMRGSAPCARRYSTRGRWPSLAA